MSPRRPTPDPSPNRPSGSDGDVGWPNAYIVSRLIWLIAFLVGAVVLLASRLASS